MNIDDPMFTAYALGEPLSPEETAMIEKFLVGSAEAQAFVEETRAFGALLKGEFQEELKGVLPTEPKVIPMPVQKAKASPVLWWSSAAAVVAGMVVIGAVIASRPAAMPLADAAPAKVEQKRADETVASSSPALSKAEVAAITAETDRALEKLREEADLQGQVALEGSRPSDVSTIRPPMIPPAPPVSPVAPPPPKNEAPPELSVGVDARNMTRSQFLSKVDKGWEGNPREYPQQNSQQNLHADMARQIGGFTKTWGNTHEGSGGAVPPRARAARAQLSLSVPVSPEDTDALLLPSTGITGEGYTALPENAFVETAAAPLSTFSLDVDTASYANVRRLLRQGTLPPAGAVRLEEMVNYFDYDDPAPDGAQGAAPLGVTLQSAEAPWAPEHRLVRIAVKARDVDREQIKGVNLVFLIDVSGSMRPGNKLPLVQKSLRRLLDQLGKDDRVAIVTYAGTSDTALESTPVSEREKILAVIDGLVASGGTNGAGGLEKAYGTARAGFIKDGVNRVILATDGDFNVGMTQNAELEDAIEAEAKSGVYLTVLGFGMGNYQDSRMKLLSTKGAGNYAYIDSEQEAHRVLVEQMRGTLVTVAKDVKVQVEFNPAKVQSYRLLGYENRLMAKEDFNNDQKDAGDIGAGHHITALYEVIPVGATPRVDPLKYAPEEGKPKHPAVESDEWLTVKVRYKAPAGEKSERLEFPYTDGGATLEKSSDDLRFAAAVAQFSQLLTRSAHAGSASWESTLSLAEGALGEDPHGRRAEFLTLISRARELSEGMGGNGWKR